MRRNEIWLLLFLLALICGESEARAQSLQTWLDGKIEGLIATKIDLRDDSRRPETPSGGETSTTIVDPSSTPSLVGLAMNLAGLPSSAEGDDDSAVSVTLNAYSFRAAFEGKDPMDPEFYLKNEKWRDLSFTLGYDDEPVAEDSEETQRAQIVGLKYLLIDNRKPSKQTTQLGIIQQQLATTTKAFTVLLNRLQEFILSQPEVRNDLRAAYETQLNNQALSAADIQATVGSAPFIAHPNAPITTSWKPEQIIFYTNFRNSLFGANFTTTLSNLSPKVTEELEAIVESEIDSFVLLEETTQKALAKINQAPQFSVSLTSRQRTEGSDDFSGQLIYDQGIGGRANLTLNGSYDYKDNKGEDEDVHGERIAAQLSFDLAPRRTIAGRDPFHSSISVEAKRMSGEEDILKGQVKLVIPVLDGVELPLSVTFANRTELIEEEDVRGHFGFTLDIARLVDAFKPN